MKKILTSFVMLNVFIFCMVFQKPRMKSKQKQYDCAIVCGYPANKDGEPSELMKTRVDKAISLWKEGKVSNIILSGAAVGNKHIEAEVMKKYAKAQGVSEDVMIEEKLAVSTYHNMMYAKEIMQSHNFKTCVIVTNGWHLRKANHYARKFKLLYVMAKADNPKDENKITTLWRYVSVNLHMYYMMFKGYY